MVFCFVFQDIFDRDFYQIEGDFSNPSSHMVQASEKNNKLKNNQGLKVFSRDMTARAYYLLWELIQILHISL
ncbi:hypothetical protein OIU79_000558 [Salix purpurea]|uniref:Uncharacterized protein n=1 Tax=Salix purpurea TaxID=77065 RepID=A0A9Q0ZN14_SALPP|nr:hypothetical protein OIU79_000558 [Salix purpurea]